MNVDLIKPLSFTVEINGKEFEALYAALWPPREIKMIHGEILDGFYNWHTDGGSDHNSKYQRYIYGISPPIEKSGALPKGYVRNNNLVGKTRKISMTLNLNVPGDYDGGNLKFDFGQNSLKEDRIKECVEIRPQGSMIVFPSFLHHCVTPVTKGTRYSLVLWCVGEPWK